MRVVVTGGAGYIGGQTVLQLLDQGHSVFAIDRRCSPDHLKQWGAKWLQRDFADEYALNAIQQFRPDAIIHCAGTSLVGPSIMNPEEYYHNNFVKTKRLCDFLLTMEIKPRIIFSSSAATYGNPIITPCQEVDPTEPISPYGESKLMVEWMLASYQQAYSLDYVAFRYFNACGADSQTRHGQESGATHIIARVLESLRDNKEFILNGNDYPTPDGTCIRDYVHVEDIANAHVKAMDITIPSGVYNLGTNTGISNYEIINIAERITEKKLKVVLGSKRNGDPAFLTASADKWQKISGLQFMYNLEDIINHVYKWYTRD